MIWKNMALILILQPLINDMKTLETEGLDLPVSAEKVHGTVCQITGDNLEMNAILGFTVF